MANWRDVLFPVDISEGSASTWLFRTTRKGFLSGAEARNSEWAQPKYRLDVTLADGRWDLGVWGSNLTDEQYLIDAGNTGRQFGTPTFVAGQPRAYGISAKVRF